MRMHDDTYRCDDRYRPRSFVLDDPCPQRSLHAVLVESARMVFCASLVLFTFSASAFDLDGAWVTILEKEQPNSDVSQCGHFRGVAF
jgi:hypothetical protein